VCAGVAIGDKLLLVDLAYVWFGAPHQEFEVEDDIRVIAAHLAQSSDLAKEQAALTLAPDWAPAYFWASCNQSRRGLQRHAEGTLAAGLKLDSTSWVALLAQAFVETHAEAWEAAEAHLGQCIAVNPDLNVLKFYLATVLYAKGDVTDARDEFRSYLSGETTPQYESKAKLALAEINKSLASKLDLNKFPSKPSP
jgi:hypothetical protein